MSAAGRLGELGIKAQAAIPSLIQALGDTNAEVGMAAADALAKMAPASTEPLILELANGASEDSRLASMQALAKIPTEDATLTLVQALKDRSVPIQRTAAHYLERKPEARGSLPELEKLLESDGLNVRIAAAQLLWRIDHRRRETVPILTEGLSATDRYWASECIATLMEMKEKPPELISKLRELTLVGHEEARVEAARKLWKITQDAAFILPSLTELLSNDSAFHYSAIGLLCDMGPAAKPAIPALRWVSTNASDPRLRWQANLCLSNFDLTQPDKARTN